VDVGWQRHVADFVEGVAWNLVLEETEGTFAEPSPAGEDSDF